MQRQFAVITIPPNSFDLNFGVHLGKAEWEWIAEKLIAAAKEGGVWMPLKQEELPLNENIMLENPRQAIAEMIAAGYLVYTEDGYWLTQGALSDILGWQKVKKTAQEKAVASISSI